ncbi:hypothetical protein DFS34DRAFT_595435 [Phlyctochytrium arcticum]|nr:hypothetical protein DFS34DRAFT_595435 [Phlyctochytrium arcticum]
MEVLSTNLFALLGDDGGDETPKPVQKDVKKAAPQKKEAPVTRSDKKPNDRPIRNEYAPRGGHKQSGAVEGPTSDDCGDGDSTDSTDEAQVLQTPVNAGLVDSDPNCHLLAERTPRGGRDNREPREKNNGDFTPREGGRDTRERGGHQGGRGGRSGYRGREFDRHSGSGRTDGYKKEVAGTGSWGNPVTAEEEAQTDAQAEVKAATESAEGENAEVSAETEEKKEPEEVLKTLEQYFAELAKPSAATNIRKANEGADDSQWKDAVVLKKEEEGTLFAELAKPGKKKGGVKERSQKAFVAIDQRFADEQRGGFGRGESRGGRGGDRKGGDRRGDRASDRNGNNDRRRGGGRGSAVNVTDTNAFPSLGGK